MKLIIALFGVRLYWLYPKRLALYVGPWSIDFGPWSRSSRYSNGSHWHSGWHCWREEMID